MATLNPFQQYSQGENTITNNVLLMMSNLYDINPKYYEHFIKALTDDSDGYEVIPNFRQQVGNRGDGVIDGHIETKATKIIIETKRHGLENIDKLTKYGKSFNKNEHHLLFHLSIDNYNESQIVQIDKTLKNLYEFGHINFYSLSYQDLIDQLTDVASTYPFEIQLQKLLENFSEYCKNMGLMPRSNHVLRAMACGQSFDLNVKHQFYFDLAERGFSPFNYLGIYRWKAVRYIGKVEKEIVADWDEDLGLKIKWPNADEVTEAQKTRLITAIKDSLDEGWGVNYNHRFFLLKDFEETDFKKTTPGGIFRVRYFNLEDYFNEISSNMKELAFNLRSKTWEILS